MAVLAGGNSGFHLLCAKKLEGLRSSFSPVIALLTRVERREGKKMFQSDFKKQGDSTTFYFRLNSTNLSSCFLDLNKA